MSLSIIQFIVLAIAIIYIVKSAKLFSSELTRARKIRTIIFLIVWLIIALFALFPELASMVSGLLNSGANLNTLIFLGLTLLFALNYKLTLKIEKMDKEFTKLVRAQAIRDYENKHKK